MTKPIPRPGDDAQGADRAPGSAPEGGEAACWAQLVCPECGAITTEGHQKDCPLAAQSQEAPGLQ